MKVELPVNTTAKVGLPLRDGRPATLLHNGKEVEAHLEGSHLFPGEIGPGTHVLVCK